MDEKLDMRQQHALTAQNANHILGFIKRSMSSRSREGILPLYCGETPSGVLHPALEPSAQERQTCWSGSRDGPQRRSKGWSTYEESLRALGLFSLEKRRVRGDLSEAFQYLRDLRKMGTMILATPVVKGQGVMFLN